MAVTGLRTWLSTLVRELGKISHYNSEGERLLRAMRNGSKLQQPDELGVGAVRFKPPARRRGGQGALVISSTRPV